MPPMSAEDLEWFKSTFRPIPRPQLPEDAIEYSLFLLSSDPAPATTDTVVQRRARLQEVQKSASELVKDLLKNYIWQRETFGLEIVKENDITFLRGRTNFGDSIEDEWVIVYLLRELTKKHQDLWVRVVDSDGEFLLVEAASSLPTWLEPEVADHRVWVNNGHLVIIKPKNDRKRVTENITLEESLKIALHEPGRLLRDSNIEEEAFYRLRKYPKQIKENLHCALVTIPRKVAYLLHQKPAYISPAVEAFYIRDPISLRTLRARGKDDLLFPPDDFVTVSVRFTRVGYAQVKSQDFPPPASWAQSLPPPTDTKRFAKAETGMKVTCGFEMLLGDPQNQDKPIIREIKLLLEDLDTGDEELPTVDEIQKTWSMQRDDESWLDISFEDLDTELKGQRDKSMEAGAFGDQSAQENLQRIVARFEEFLKDDSADFDGVNLYDSDTDDEPDDEEASSEDDEGDLRFDEEEFVKFMKDMKMDPSGVDLRSILNKSSKGRVEELEPSEEDDSHEIEELSRQMEAELRPTGVLNISNQDPGRNPGAVKGKGKDKGKQRPMPEDFDFDEEDPANIHLVKNLLESLQSQAGMPGPAGNLLGMMGMKMPPDDRKRKS
ncbi:regulatory factor Sgt1, putative [Talaromyces stipitatus ATCC 10500]|uniref:Regulatory factor Sgt1, putative n=1 Tax=Talaromyces stipitatus (strain ATCC 10500 / CBS 375.48 / QM 6759 / NRRL 1006) TaxID=441959 RepID=B8M785_TALSN|nr:regulatory factor Sgt1, putative [Talaromyces stipitatus ATCC 10500]EED20305.1 regulatory factor Sgt1, putative [Talaromyces stipitatus ATCC 10500]